MKGLRLPLMVVLVSALVAPVATGSSGDPDDIPSCFGREPTIIGTTGPDILTGTDGSDVIMGLNGKDVIYGLGARDFICGGGGADEIHGGLGGDKIEGQGGDDVIMGDGGNDRIKGGHGNDTLIGGKKDDVVNGQGETDICEGEQVKNCEDGGPPATTTTTTTTTTIPTQLGIQAIYAYPLEVRPVSRSAAMRTEIGEALGWYDGQTGGRHPVFTKTDRGVISVFEVQIPYTPSQFLALADPHGAIADHVNSVHPSTVGRQLFIVYEGRSSNGACGSTWSGHVLIPLPNCGFDDPFSGLAGHQWPFGMTYLTAHELAHALGAVPFCAPNEGNGQHVTDDSRDLLYVGPGGRDFFNLVLDAGNDDYYNHSNAGCYDIADNPLLGTD